MNPVRSCRNGDINPSVDKDPAGRTPGELYRFPSQVEKQPPGQLFFTYLNKIDSPNKCSSHVQQKRSDGWIGQLTAIGDVIKQGPSSGDRAYSGAS